MTEFHWHAASSSTASVSADLPNAVRQLAIELDAAGIRLHEYTTETGAYVFTVDLDDVVRWARGAKQAELDWPILEPTGVETVIVAGETLASEAIEALFRDLVAARLPGPVPTWGTTRSGAPVLEVYRRAGSMATLLIHPAGAGELRLHLFPITLDALTPTRKRLTPERKLPEGGEDNLKQRADWFGRQFGDKHNK
jgi:hypothetical protein